MQTNLNPSELDATTLEIAGSDIAGALDLLERWTDHLDTKTLGVFAMGALVIGVIPAVRGADLTTVSILALLAGVSSWVVLGIYALKALRPAGQWRLLRPERLLVPEWLTLPPSAYRLSRMEYMAEQYADNVTAYRAKRAAFTTALVALSVEVVALTVLALA